MKRLGSPFGWMVGFVICLTSCSGASRDPIPKSHWKIIGGHTVSEPLDFFASLFPVESEVGSYCGGVYLGQGVVLTAAHCVYNLSHPIQVGVGHVRDISLPGSPLSEKLYPVVGVEVHDGFDSQTHQNDIALVFLAPNELGSLPPDPKSLLLPESLSHRSVPGKTLTVYGFGAQTSFGNIASHELRRVTVSHLNPTGCDLYEQFGQGQLCVGVLEGGKDACQGDSGGPLLLPLGTSKFSLVGLVGYGTRCAQPRFPSIYTDVSHYLKWIESKIFRYRSRVLLPKVSQLEQGFHWGCYMGLGQVIQKEPGVPGSPDALGLLQVTGRYAPKAPFQSMEPPLAPLRKVESLVVPLCQTQDGMEYVLPPSQPRGQEPRIWAKWKESWYEAPAKEDSEVLFRCLNTFPEGSDLPGLLEVRSDKNKVSFYANDTVYLGKMDNPAFDLLHSLFFLNETLEAQCEFKNHQIRLKSTSQIPVGFSESWYRIESDGLEKVLPPRSLYVKKTNVDPVHEVQVLQLDTRDDKDISVTFINRSVDVAVYGVEISCSQSFQVWVDGEKSQVVKSQPKGNSFHVLYGGNHLPGGFIARRDGIRTYHFQFLNSEGESEKPKAFCSLNNWIQFNLSI